MNQLESVWIFEINNNKKKANWLCRNTFFFAIWKFQAENCLFIKYARISAYFELCAMSCQYDNMCVSVWSQADQLIFWPIESVFGHFRASGNLSVWNVSVWKSCWSNLPQKLLSTRTKTVLVTIEPTSTILLSWKWFVFDCQFNSVYMKPARKQWK